MSTASPNEAARIISVGIDIGNSKCVVAISNNGAGDEDYCFHETPTVVHFARNHRLFGVGGANQATFNPTSTISHLKRLVGFTANSKNSHDELLRLPYETSLDADGGVSVNVRYLEENHSFTAVELLVMLLSHLRRVAEKAMGSAASYCVIGVPSFFSSPQRRAYLDAALIAGWNTLKLLDDGTAAALDYRSKRKGSTDAAVVVAFMNIGHCDTQVTVVRFQGRTMRVIADAHDQYLGGRDFDEVLFQYLVGDFRELTGIDVSSDVKVATKLRTACENVKKALTEKKEAELRVDSLFRGVDVSWVITREELERMSSGLLNRIAAVFGEALTNANLSLGGVHSIELVGSGSRIPAISGKLANLFGREVGRTLDPSNCVAFGCALQCEKMLQNNNTRETERVSRITSRFGTSSIEFVPIGIRKNAFLKAKDIEEKLAQQDKMVERAEERRNSLADYISKSRNKMKNGEITDESEREKISTKLAQMEDWLLVEGDDQPENVYEDKLLELISVWLVSPIGHDGEGTQVQMIGKVIQTGITAPPMPGGSTRSYAGEVSGECSGTKPSDGISPRKDEMSSQDRLEANASSMRRLPLTGEQRQMSSSSRSNDSSLLPKNRTKSLRKKICSICKLCRGTDATSPSPR